MALAGWLTWHDPGRTWQKPDPSRTQTCYRRVRRATPYPLGHGHGWWKSDQHSVVLGQHGMDSDHDCTKIHPKNRGPAMALVAFCLLWRCCTGMLHAAHSLLCRRCLLQVDVTAMPMLCLLFQQRQEIPSLRTETGVHHSTCWPVATTARGDTRTRTRLRRRKAPALGGKRLHTAAQAHVLDHAAHLLTRITGWWK